MKINKKIGVQVTSKGVRALELLNKGYSLKDVERITDEEFPETKKTIKMTREEFGEIFKKNKVVH